MDRSRDMPVSGERSSSWEETVVSRRTFIRVIVGAGVVVGAGGLALTQVDRMPAEAIAGWRGPAPELKDPRLRALAYALLAPNPHNMQSWIADLREPDAITFYCDKTRLLPQTDPYSRQIVIGCGCFLETLRIAALAHGFSIEATYFPQGSWPENDVGDAPLARLVFVPDAAAARDPLFDQITLRRSGKVDYADRPVSADDAGAMFAALETPSVASAWTAAPDAVAKLRAIADASYRVEAGTHRTHMETVERMRIGAREIAQHRDGLFIHGGTIWLLNAAGVLTREAMAEPGSFAYRATLDLYGGWIKNTWSFGWLTTQANDRIAQLEAGRAYVRANLRATALGLSIAPLSQALQEFPEMAEQMAAMRAATGTPDGHTLQMFFRMGYGAAAPPTPRRALDDIVRA